MMRREADLILVIACSVALTVVMLAFPSAEPARIVLGLPFVLFFPGYTLMAALFPRKDDLGPTERIALSLGLSIAVVPLIALALNYSPWHITLNPILAFITLLIVLTAMAALIQRRTLPVDEAFTVTIDIQLPRWPQVRLADRLLAAGMVLALVGALGMAVFLATSRGSAARFTEFYILGPAGKAEGYPSQLRVGDKATVVLGIVNHEGQDTAHRVAVRMDGKITDSFDNPVLADGDRWEERVTLTPTHAVGSRKVEFLLYKDGGSEPYRSLHLWLTVKPVEVERAMVETLPRPEPVVLPESAPASEEEAPPPEPTPPPQPTPPPAEPPTVHIVVAGENLTRIARDYGLTLGALLAVNEIENPNLIYPNQPIRLPPHAGERESQ